MAFRERCVMSFISKSSVVVVVAVLVAYWPKGKDPNNDMSGACDPRFEAVSNVFRSNIETGWDKGSSFAVYYEGNLVCDLWGGISDTKFKSTWNQETLSNLFSATKGIVALAVAILVDRGYLRYDQRVSHYWPEFAQNGKDDITVEELLSHQAGLAALTVATITPDVLKNHQFSKLEKILAAQRPNWKPGTQHGYHALTLGFYVDTLLQRSDATKRGLLRIVQEEIVQPLALDFHSILSRKHTQRTTFIELPPWYKILWRSLWVNDARNLKGKMLISPQSLTALAFNNPMLFSKANKSRINWPEYQSMHLPGITGYGTARSLAKLYGVLANGGKFEKHTILSPSTLERLGKPVVSGQDLILGTNITFGPGMHLTNYKHHNMFGHFGEGGQAAYADPERQLGWSYVTNHPSVHYHSMDPRYESLIAAMYKCVASANPHGY